jgi:hypothetical protein
MNRNELLNLLYLDRGASIVGVIYTSGSLFDPYTQTINGKPRQQVVETYAPDEDDGDMIAYAARVKGATIYHYRAAPDMILAKGDLVVVPSKDTVTLATVVEVHRSIPPGLKPTVTLKWVAQKVDLRRLKELEADEARVIETVRNAEVKTKLVEIEKSMGFPLDSIATPALMPPPVTAK